MENTPYDSDPTDKIEIYSTDDEKIKTLGGLFSSDSSRTILNLLFENEMSASEIANKTEMSLELVRHHIQKMQKIGLVRISKIEKNSRAQEIKYYISKKFVIMVLPPTISEKAKNSKGLLKNLKKVYHFAAIGIAAISTWFVTNIILTPSSITLDRPMSGPDESIGFWSGIASLSIIILGLIIERSGISIKALMKKRKRSSSKDNTSITIN
jgi:SepF-like predicted cell division protein (DUF552 family)